MKIIEKYHLSPADIDRIVEMAWEDRTPFEAIEAQFGLKEQEVVELMRSQIKKSSWKHWRKRVNCRKTKHLRKKIEPVGRFRCSRQKAISHNKIT